MGQDGSVSEKFQLPWRYRAYAPVVKALSLLGRVQVIGRHPFLVLRTVINRLMYRFILKDPAILCVNAKPGFKICVPLNDQGAASIVFLREYGRDEVTLIRRLMPFSSSFIDIGCNVGYFSMFVKAVAGPRFDVVSLDPNKFLCGLVRRSAAVNHYEKIDIRNAAAGQQIGQAFFEVDTRLSTSGRITFGDPQNLTDARGEIQVVMLDDLVPVSAESSDQKVPLIKIDVEGHEVEVLKGGLSVIKRGAIILCEVWGRTAASLAEIARTHGYQILNHQGSRLSADEMACVRRSDVILIPDGFCEKVREALAGAMSRNS